MGNLVSQCESLEYQNAISCYADEIKAKQRAISPQWGDKVADELMTAFEYIQKNTEVSVDPFDDNAARAQALEGFRSVESALSDYSPNSDSLQLLNDYATSYHLYKATCDGVYGERRSETVSCDTLHEKEAGFSLEIGRIGRSHFFTKNDFYVSAYGGLNYPEEVMTYEGSGSRYLTEGFVIGLHHFLNDENAPAFLHFTGPILEVGVDRFAMLKSPELTLGSNRVELALRAGWRQYFFDRVYLTAKAGPGVSFNWLNFGQGFPIEEKTSFMFGAQAQMGVQFLNNTMAIETGYFYEGTVAGAPEYINQGPLVMVTRKSFGQKRRSP